MNIDRAMDYVEFVIERHRIWERRQAGDPGPWTTDPVLASRKFTNVFRLLDHDSQWLMRNLLDGEPRDVLMRCFLFRHTGRVEAWQYLFDCFGVPDWDDLDFVLRIWHEYRGKTTIKKKPPRRPGQTGPGNGNQTSVSERPLFTSAYLVFPQSQVPGTDKIRSIIELTRRLFTPGSPDDVVPDFLAAKTQAERFAVLRRNKGVADFMSQQILTDWGYTTEDRENEFIVLGPGARRGIREVFGRESVDDLVVAREMLGDEAPRLAGREPSLMDLQNCFCEFGKYVRYVERDTVQSKPYQARHQAVPPEFPRLW